MLGRGGREDAAHWCAEVVMQSVLGVAVSFRGSSIILTTIKLSINFIYEKLIFIGSYSYHMG